MVPDSINPFVLLKSLHGRIPMEQWDQKAQAVLMILKKLRSHCDFLETRWEREARPAQRIPDGTWKTWLILAGRGFGKTRTGAETIKIWVSEGKAKRIALVGRTLHETREIMVEGESGLLSVYPP